MDYNLVYKILKSEIKSGVNFKENFIFYKKDDSIKATYNSCQHHGGRFVCDDDCIVRCIRHNWKLNVSKMEYSSPVGVKQDEVMIKENEDFYEIYDKSIPTWCEVPTKKSLERNEATIKYYSHACAEFTFGDKRIFTDPWLEGPCFLSGWWLENEPPLDWLEKLSSCDVIYISHAHSDHLHEETLRILKNKNPNVKIIIPNFSSCLSLLKNIGFLNIEVMDFQEWYVIDNDLKVMILKDLSSEDSGLLIDYKGYRILNTVDCSNKLNGGIYPEVDCLLSGYATVSTGYPTCWGDNYGDDGIHKRVMKVHQSTKKEVIDHINNCNPKLYILWAASAYIGHPRDKYIKDRNIPLSSETLTGILNRKFKDLKLWNPKPGDVYDLSTYELVEEGKEKSIDIDYDYYSDKYKNNLELTLTDIKKYFKNSGYESDLILHICETNEDFTLTDREFIYDFTNQDFIDKRPNREHRYLKMKVRKEIFKYVLHNYLPWEEISIGFQGRFYREPDIYNRDFWEHFQKEMY